MKTKLFFNIICSILVCCFSACELMPGKSGDSSNPWKVGKSVIDFSFENEGGTLYQISDYKNTNVILLKLWNIGCKTCVASLPELDTLHDTYGGAGLLVMGVNPDDTKQQIL